MKKEQLTSNGPEANLFKLEGKGIWITYGILRSRREFLDYRDEQRELTFSADRGEIESLESNIGKQITVRLEEVSDSHTLTLTLLLPKINLGGQQTAVANQENSFETLAIRTKHLTSIGGPALIKGPLQTYEVLSLQGVASQAD